MTIIPIKTPSIAKKIFSNYTWDLPSDEKVIYLTFDDGPTEEITPWVLRQLKSFNARATFFCIGNNIDKNPHIFKNIIEEGHTIGNHTYNHLKGWKSKTKDYLRNVELCEEAVKSHIPVPVVIANKNANLFRPPYGKLKPKQGKKLIEQGYKIIMWDVLSFDWDQSINKETCLNNVLSKTTSGSIVVFHDSEKAARNMQYALPKTLDYFSNQGFCFKSIAL